MRRRPRPRDTVIMTPAVMITVGLAGLFIAGCLDGLIAFGKSEYGSYAIGSTMALTAFALALFVTAYESRSQTDTTLRQSTFDNRTLNLVILVELAVAVLTTRGGALSSLLGTERLTSDQWFLSLTPAAGLFVLWELGKLVARRSGVASETTGATPEPVGATP